MVNVVFCIQLREDVDLPAFQRDTALMFERLAECPEFEFLGAKAYHADDGEFVMVVQFGSDQGVAAWGKDPEHRVIIERGVTDYFETAWLANFNPRMTFDRVDGLQYP